MADEIVKIIKIESAGSEQTVKGLKKEIEGLRDALLNTEKGSDEYKKILDNLIDSQKRLTDVMSAGRNESKAAEGSYNALKNEMSALKKVWQEVTDEASRGEIGKRIEEINTELKTMDASIGNFQRNVGNYASGFKSARQELSELKNQMDNMQQGTAEYNAAFQRAAEITHNLQERQEQLKYSSADLGTQLSNIASIGSSIAAGFNAINGVIALTGSKSEELQKTMVKLQAGIALVQGLQGLEGMTKRMKGLVDGLTEMIFKTRETATAVNTETTAIGANTAAQEANTVATNAATVATKGFQKALVATGIGAIVVLLGTLIANWDRLKDAIGLSSEKLERFREILDNVKAGIMGVANAVAQYFIMPFKNAAYSIQMVGNVLKDVFTFQWGKIGDDVKEGMSNIADSTKKGFSFVQNYQEAAEKQQEKNAENRRKRLNAASAQELDDLIKDNEAKLGAEWKYTEEGKKIYDEYFEKKLSTYKKDSKEYKDLLRQKWAYDREYQKHLEDAEKSGKGTVSNISKTTDALLAEVDKIEKRAIDSQKTELQLVREKYEEEKALLEAYGRDTTALTAEYEKKVTDIVEKEEQKRRNEAEKTRQQEEKIAREKAMKVLRQSRNNLQNNTDEYNNERTRIELEYSWKEAKQSGALSYNDIIEETNRIYQANKEYLQAQAAEYKALMENVDADDETRLDAKRDYYNTLTEMDNLATQNLIDNVNLQREAVQAQIEMYQDLANTISSIFGTIADMMEDDIQEKIKNGEITQEEGEKQFKAVKAFQIAQATIQTISGAISAFMQAQGKPFGLIIGAANAAAVTAAGVAQISKIKSTQLGSNSSISSQMGAGITQTESEQYIAPYTQNATGESELTRLADNIQNQRVYVVESDITEAQNRSKVRVTESTW